MHLRVSLFDAHDSPVDKVLILGYRLLFQPYVELTLDKVHLKLRVPLDALIISQHALTLK